MVLNEASSGRFCTVGRRCVTSKEAAIVIGVDAKTLANWRWQGRGPEYIKLPGRSGKGAVRYDFETLLSWLAQNTHASTASMQASMPRKA